MDWGGLTGQADLTCERRVGLGEGVLHSWALPATGVLKGCMQRRAPGVLGILFLDLGTGYMDPFSLLKFTELFVFDKHIFLHVCYTAIKKLKSAECQLHQSGLLFSFLPIQMQVPLL